jgi:hypothetical protein
MRRFNTHNAPVVGVGPFGGGGQGFKLKKHWPNLVLTEPEARLGTDPRKK